MDEEKKLTDKIEDKREDKKAEDKSAEKRRPFKSVLSDYKGEYKKIIWPTKKELIKETAIVIVTCIIVGAIITSLDMIFSNGYSLLVNLTNSL